MSGRQVKWIVALSRPVAGLSQSRVRGDGPDLGHERQRGEPPADRREAPASAAGASARATNHSLWSSSPALGTWSIRKWGSRSCHGPGIPRWIVHASGDIPGIGWTSRRGPTRVAGGRPAPSLGERRPSRRPPPAASPRPGGTTGRLQSVNRLTDVPAAMISSNRSSTRLEGRRPRTRPGATSIRGLDRERDRRDDAERAEGHDDAVRSRIVGSGSPSPAGLAVRTGGGRRPASRAPRARTAVASEPRRGPEPWVAVAQAPAIEMCGSEARLWRAYPAASSAPHTSP